jgi:phosphate starvation-inducible PhoH-like protein
LCGQFNEHLHQLEHRFSIEINHRGNTFRLLGEDEKIQQVAVIIKQLYASDEPINLEKIHLTSQESNVENSTVDNNLEIEEIHIRTRRGIIKGRGFNQQKYLHNIVTHNINFGIGPAGTGKTYLAVACAVEALEQEEIKRIVLVRPAVEAGEKLGFLPGDLSQKVDPYLRPLYDALYEMLGLERVGKLIERNIIEVAPLAYMRGRTLNESFIILDEAQNTTKEQMKMFLTRLGFNSTAVITGDITQIDLPRDHDSGLKHVINILNDIDGISFNFFTANDVVRHQIVSDIIRAYEKYEI